MGSCPNSPYFFQHNYSICQGSDRLTKVKYGAIIHVSKSESLIKVLFQVIIFNPGFHSEILDFGWLKPASTEKADPERSWLCKVPAPQSGGPSCRSAICGPCSNAKERCEPDAESLGTTLIRYCLKRTVPVFLLGHCKALKYIVVH